MNAESNQMARTVAAVVTISLGATFANAQSFGLSWFTIDSGGATFITGGNFELSGTIGQHDAGAMTGGDFELVGGFWALGSASGGPPCDPCDANCDGSVDLTDVEPFILLLLGGDPCGACAGDTNGDGSIDLTDVEPFIECLLG